MRSPVRRLLAVSTAGWLILVPHTHEDFAYGEPADLTLPFWAAASLVALGYGLLAVSQVGSARDWRPAHILHALVAIVWALGAAAAHGPDVMNAGHRSGIPSRLLELGIMIWGLITAWLAWRAARSRSGKA